VKRVLPILAYLFLGTLHRLLRVRHVRLHHLENAPQHVILFWHECVLLALYAKWRRPTITISSQSKDGDIMVSIMKLYGVRDPARGSSNRGGTKALRHVLRAARDGINIAVTPDGPKGPRRVVKEGVVYIAQMSGLVIVPFHFTAKRKKRLRSWDRMIFPIPFSKAIYLYGEPIVVPRDGDVEEWRLRIEHTLNDLAEEAERDFDALWAEGAQRR
jgi:lysophospholipid acyltransferase (LPLAT)-like uncharacterized protein